MERGAAAGEGVGRTFSLYRGGEKRKFGRRERAAAVFIDLHLLKIRR
jgi:hypothetical protein